MEFGLLLVCLNYFLPSCLGSAGMDLIYLYNMIAVMNERIAETNSFPESNI